MPSGHSSLVSSLAAAIYLDEGLSSVFILSVAFGIVVIYDAMILRMTVGRNNETLKIVAKKLKINKTNHKITNSHGHTPLQVIIGAIIGIFIAIIVSKINFGI